MGRKRILLIEDDPSLLLTMRYVLEDSGYDIVSATNHSDVRAALAQGTYDLAIVDYFLDNIPAADLIVEMRAQHPRMPLVCSTAHRRVVRRQGCVEEGGTGARLAHRKQAGSWRQEIEGGTGARLAHRKQAGSWRQEIAFKETILQTGYVRTTCTPRRR